MKQPEQKNIWVVIPAFNEESAIAKTAASVRALGYQAVVVNDCSTDNTQQAAVEAGITTLSHIINLGQGAALQTGINFALTQNAEYIVTFDADGQHLADEIERLLSALRTGQFDAALGSRFLTGGRAISIPPVRRLLLRFATVYTRISTGLKVTDTHNGFRAFTANAARRLYITQNRMSHASQILSQIKRLSLRYTEVPVTIVYTEYSMKKGQRISNAFNIIWESLMESFGV